MCEFTTYLDGHEDGNIVAQRIVKAIVKPDYVSLMAADGRSVKIPNAYITKVDTIMTELHLKTKE